MHRQHFYSNTLLCKKKALESLQAASKITLNIKLISNLGKAVGSIMPSVKIEQTI